MLASVACSCVRNGSSMSAPAVKLLLSPSTLASLNLTAVQHLSRHRSARLLAAPPWQLAAGLSVRSVTLSASSRGDADPLGSPSALGDERDFGSLSTDMSRRRSFRKTSPYLQDLQHREENEEEEKEEQELVEPTRRPGRINTPYWYFLQCKALIKAQKLQEALDLFSKDMLKGERLQPQDYNYSVLIGGCARAGQLKKAFKLYNDMKKRGIQPSDATYTALFNACAEAPLKQAGLQQALLLEQELRRKNYALSTITYHALLKTHAVTNHLQACLHTIREMLQNRHVVTQETFHYLLMGCLKDKEVGFRLALQVWRQMLKSGILPDSKNYNLLLRTARDCGLGDPVLAARVLLGTGSDFRNKKEGVSRVRSKSGCKELDIDILERQLFFQPDSHSDSQQDGRDGEEESHSGQESTHLIPVTQGENVSLSADSAVSATAPNLLDLFEGKGIGVISFGTIDQVSDRLALIGGGEGLLDKMAAKGQRPDLRTLTLLADTMEPSYQSLQMLLRVAKQHRVKLDIAFFNSVIRRAARAGDLDGAKSVLSVMRQRHVSVNVQTFGSLALGCKQQKDGLQLLKDMEELGLRPNVQVFSALVGQASRRLDYVYLKTILERMKDVQVWPNDVIIKQLEFAAQYPPNYNQYKSRNNYLVKIDGFRGYYQEWLSRMPAQSAEDEQAAELEAMKLVPLTTEAADGETEAQRKQRAAARRYHSKNKAVSTL